VENIKAYYQQLCANYRLVSQQLQHPELPSARRQQLAVQLEKLQVALQDFTERVIRPIISANRAERGGTMSVGGVGAIPGSIGTPVQSTPIIAQQPQVVARPQIVTRVPSVGRDPAPTPLSVASIDAPRGVALGLSTAAFLDQTRSSEGILLEKSVPTKRRQVNAGNMNNASLVSAILSSDEAGNIRLDEETEELLLALADRFIATICQSVCESARHRKRPGISNKDLELVLSREANLATTVAGIPFAVPPAAPIKAPPKKSATANTHHTRIQQLRKHLGIQ
jgi:hypothetical protein